MKARSDIVVISLLSAGHGLSHFGTLIFAPLFPFMKDDLGVSYAALGFLASIFFVLSALFQPLAGFIVDRYGPRGVLLGGVGLLVAGILIAGLSTSYAMLGAGIAIAGLGNSVFHPADYAILNARISPGRLGYAFSAHGVTGYAGFALAPIFSVGIASISDWRAALIAGAALGASVLIAQVAFMSHLLVVREAPAGRRPAFGQEARVLLSGPVVMCFLYFALYSAGLAGLMSFSVVALAEQYGVAVTVSSGALTAYLVAAAIGILAGGPISAHGFAPERVAIGGLTVNALMILLVALGVVPGILLALVLAIAGFSSGVVAPSRDMIIRGATPPGATGRVYGFVYSGLDFGSLATPVLYGWLMDHALPQGVFYVAFAFMAMAIFTVMQLPQRRPAAAGSTARS